MCAWMCRNKACETSSGCVDHCATHGGGSGCYNAGCGGPTNAACTSACINAGCEAWCWRIAWDDGGCSGIFDYILIVRYTY